MGQSCNHETSLIHPPRSLVGNSCWKWQKLIREMPAHWGRSSGGTRIDLQKVMRAMKGSPPICFSFHLFLSASLPPSCSQLSPGLSFPSTHRNHHSLYLCLILILCLHLSRSTPLRKITSPIITSGLIISNTPGCPTFPPGIRRFRCPV